MDSGQQGSTWSLCASMTLLIWDIILTLEEEIKFVWQTPWSLPKMLYLVCRYVGLTSAIVMFLVSSHNHLNSFCDPANVVISVLWCTIAVSSDYLLLLRVGALYGTPGRASRLSLNVQRTMNIAFAFVLIIVLVINCMQIRASVDYALEVENFGCFTQTGLPAWAAGLAIIAVVCFNALIFVCLLIKLAPMWRRGHSGPVTELLLRDGSVYFTMIFAISLAALIMSSTLSSAEGNAAFGWFMVMIPVAISRMFLNLKAMGVSTEGNSIVPAADVDLPPEARPVFELGPLHRGLESIPEDPE